MPRKAESFPTWIPRAITTFVEGGRKPITLDFGTARSAVHARHLFYSFRKACLEGKGHYALLGIQSRDIVLSLEGQYLQIRSEESSSTDVDAQLDALGAISRDAMRQLLVDQPPSQVLLDKEMEELRRKKLKLEEAPLGLMSLLQFIKSESFTLPPPWRKVMAGGPNEALASKDFIDANMPEFIAAVDGPTLILFPSTTMEQSK